MMKEKGWKGGQMPTGLRPGQCGFDDVKSHTATYGPGEKHSAQYGREVDVDVESQRSGGKRKGK